MSVEIFELRHRVGLVNIKTGEPLEIGAEVLIVNSHVDGRYTCVGKYAGKSAGIDSDVRTKPMGYDNFVLEDTFKLPIEIVAPRTWDRPEYLARVIQTVKERGLSEGRTGHALDMATEIYRVK